jgi:hypothetical protein
MRQNLVNARNERDNNMDEILSSLLTQDKILAKKILDYIVDNQPNGYQKIFKTPSIIFTVEDLQNSLIQSFLDSLNKFANNVEDEKKEIYNVISQLSKKYNDILDAEILEQEKRLVLLKEKRSKNNRKAIIKDTIDIDDNQIEESEKKQYEIEKLSYGILESDENNENKRVGTKKEWNESKEVTSAPKFEELKELLKEMKVEILGKIYEETINEDRFREYPYKIIHIEVNGKKKTILVSDEIGQITFVYDGNIDKLSFKNAIKWYDINWVKVSKIKYLNNYSENLKKCLENQEAYWFADDWKKSWKENIQDDLILSDEWNKTSNQIIIEESKEWISDVEKGFLEKFGIQSHAFSYAYDYLELHKLDKDFAKKQIQDWIMMKFITPSWWKLKVNQPRQSPFPKSSFPWYTDKNWEKVCTADDIFDQDFLTTDEYLFRVEESLQSLNNKWKLAGTKWTLDNYTNIIEWFFYGNQEAIKLFSKKYSWNQETKNLENAYKSENILDFDLELLEKENFDFTRLTELNFINTKLEQFLECVWEEGEEEFSDLHISEQLKEKVILNCVRQRLKVNKINEIWDLWRQFPRGLIHSIISRLPNTKHFITLPEDIERKKIDLIFSQYKIWENSWNSIKEGLQDCARRISINTNVKFFGLNVQYWDLNNMNDEVKNELALELGITISQEVLMKLLAKSIVYQWTSTVENVWWSIEVKIDDFDQEELLLKCVSELYSEDDLLEGMENINTHLWISNILESGAKDEFVRKIWIMFNRHPENIRLLEETWLLDKKYNNELLKIYLQSWRVHISNLSLPEEILEWNDIYRVSVEIIKNTPESKRLEIIEKMVSKLEISLPEYINRLTHVNITLLDELKQVVIEIEEKNVYTKDKDIYFKLNYLLWNINSKTEKNIDVSINDLLWKDNFEKLREFLEEYKIWISIVGERIKEKIIHYVIEWNIDKVAKIWKYFEEYTNYIWSEHFKNIYAKKVLDNLEQNEIHKAVNALRKFPLDTQLFQEEKVMNNIKVIFIKTLEIDKIDFAIDLIDVFWIPKDYIKNIINKFPDYKEDLLEE